jgi:hypothetical protein
VRDQLAPQQITFPAVGSAGLYPDIKQYGGQQVVNGVQAHAYAEQFIARHLQTIGGGKTYSQLSAVSNANPSDTKAAAMVQTYFRGMMLRSTLDEAYAWWMVGVYASYAAIGLALAALIVLGALVFEGTQAIRARRVVVEKVRAVAPRPALQV